MDQKQKKMIDECIESHYNMIKHHRRAIIELSRKSMVESEICMECIDLKIINKTKDETL